MSSIIVNYVLFIYAICIIATISEEAEQCVPDIAKDREIQRLNHQLEMKDKQIEYLLRKLAERTETIEIGDGAGFDTCMDVKPDLHFKNVDGDDQCIHECIDARSCSDFIISCYPYDSCIINCKGHGSCNNLAIEFISAPTILNCDGFQSCIGVILNPLEEYIFEDGVIKRGPAHKYEPNEETFEWSLPNISLSYVNSTKNVVKFTESNVELTPHFILAKDALNQEILASVLKSYVKCNDEEHSEHREFGAGVYEDIEGHTVTFLDDCIDDEVYNFAKSVTHGMLGYVQQTIIEQLKSQNITNDQDKIKEFISDNWMYDWQTLMSVADEFESRCIEYITYTEAGNLGWHTDDDSNFTMVIQLNDENTFEGGILHFRLNPWDDEQYHVRLTQNDIILFPSYADHAVEPVSDGKRNVLVFEWWNIGRSTEIGRVQPMDHLETMEEQQQQT